MVVYKIKVSLPLHDILRHTTHGGPFGISKINTIEKLLGKDVINPGVKAK